MILNFVYDFAIINIEAGEVWELFGTYLFLLLNVFSALSDQVATIFHSLLVRGVNRFLCFCKTCRSLLDLICVLKHSSFSSFLYDLLKDFHVLVESDIVLLRCIPGMRVLG